jgi:2-keto-3-deoxy-L-rhamnonate aldolase RhmA
VKACNENGIAPGISTDSLEDAETLLDRGFRFMAYGHDLVLLRPRLQGGIHTFGPASKLKSTPAEVGG